MEIKDRIKQKADELYRKYGVKSVTMDEIASQMGVSKKTIYQSFSDKNELVDEVIGDMLDFNRSCCLDNNHEAKDAVHEILHTLENLENILLDLNPTILFDLERSHPATFKKFTKYKYTFLFDLVKKNIQRGLKEGIYRSEMNVDIISKVRIESLILPFREELFPKNQYALMDIQKELVEFFLYGMVNAKGHELILKYKKEKSKKPEQ